MAAGRLTVVQCMRVCVFSLLLVCGHCLNLACIEVKKAYTDKGFNENEVPIQAISGEHLEICPQGFTCCTTDMEQKLRSLSKKEYDKYLDEAYRYVKTTFTSRTKKFDEFFTELLDNAKVDLHDMFVKTYGLLYQQNSHVFTALFRDLRDYYKGRDINLVSVLGNFFSTLLKKMFELLNTGFKFDNSYLNCVTEHMDELKPFGDVPQKLSVQVKRAFIAARTFVQGLAIGRDVVLTVSKIRPAEACVKALMKMMYCPHCRGLTRTKPCNNYCLNTMKGCLAYQQELNGAWNEYIDAMKMLAIRLEGPFNIESVVDPIDVKISDAIMNLQENSKTVSSQIFAGCGQPRLSRKKRDTEEAAEKVEGEAEAVLPTLQKDEPLATSEVVEDGDPSKRQSGNPEKTADRTYSSYSFELPSNKNPQARPTTAAGTSLDRLVKDIKEKVKSAKDFWLQLPYTVCNDDEVAAQPGNDEDCWNGQDRARYIPAVQKDGVINQINNPEVEVDITHQTKAIVDQQIHQLKLVTGLLRSAYNGVDVDWIVTEIEGSGSGSGTIDLGSGSGSGSGDDWDDDEDRPRKNKPKGGKGKKSYGATKDPDFDFGPEYKRPTTTSPKSKSPGSSSIRQCVPSWLNIVFVLLTLKALQLLQATH